MLTKELTRSKRLPFGKQVKWNHKLQEFQLKNIGKSKRPLIKFKDNKEYINKRNKREGTKLWF